MPRDDDTHPIGDMEFAKTRFVEGLKRCRALVAECRSKLSEARRASNDDTPIFGWPRKPNDDRPKD